MLTQERPNDSNTEALEHAAFIAIQRLASDLSQGVVELLKGASLSGPQYNVLRILRGAGSAGLACGEVADRLIAKDPDMTRLLDRLEKRELVVRTRESEDRRIVTTRISPAGLQLLASLDEPISRLHRSQLAHLGTDKLQALLALLKEARSQSA